MSADTAHKSNDSANKVVVAPVAQDVRQRDDRPDSAAQEEENAQKGDDAWEYPPNCLRHLRLAATSAPEPNAESEPSEKCLISLGESLALADRCSARHCARRDSSAHRTTRIGFRSAAGVASA